MHVSITSELISLISNRKICTIRTHALRPPRVACFGHAGWLVWGDRPGCRSRHFKEQKRCTKLNSPAALKGSCQVLTVRPNLRRLPHEGRPL